MEGLGMCFEGTDVIGIEPIVESVVQQVLCLGVDEIVRYDGIEERRVDALDLKRQPSAVTGGVRKELAFVAGGAERSQTQAAFLAIPVRGAFVDIRGGDDRLHLVQFTVGECIN